MKGETCKYPYKAEPPCDFNPRTHEGCDQTFLSQIVPNHISIHAPMKGATLLCLYLMVVHQHFNPRTHEGCDIVIMALVAIVVLFQSTHP